MSTTKHVYISGRVQNVGFRHFTKTNAGKLGVNGWVKNLDDGRVEAVFHGEDEAVDKMLKLVSEGPGHSRVADVETEELNGEDYRNFQVRY